MTTDVTQEVLDHYDKKIKTRLEHRPTDKEKLKAWMEEINDLIFEANMLASYEKYKPITK